METRVMTAGLWMLRRGASERNAEHAVLAVPSLLFAASATLRIVWCTPMSAMDAMPMPGGWTMSKAWMRMRFCARKAPAFNDAIPVARESDLATTSAQQGDRDGEEPEEI
jgi:hypothetical protein